MSVDGGRLADLAGLADIDVPAVGPFRIKGESNGSMNALSLANIEGRIGAGTAIDVTLADGRVDACKKALDQATARRDEAQGDAAASEDAPSDRD